MIVQKLDITLAELHVEGQLVHQNLVELQRLHLPLGEIRHALHAL